LASRLAAGAVILAAGKSTRFGSDKRQFRLAGGKPMLDTTLATYAVAFGEICLVLKPSDENWASQLTEAHPAYAPHAGSASAQTSGNSRLTKLHTVYAPDSALGMGHSLAAGVRAGRRLDVLFVALADMPDVHVETLTALKAAVTGPKSIVQPIYGGAPGHPVGFGSHYFGALERLTGDTGAKPVLIANWDRIKRVETDDPGVTRDYDVPP